MINTYTIFSCDRKKNPLFDFLCLRICDPTFDDDSSESKPWEESFSFPEISGFRQSWFPVFCTENGSSMFNTARREGNEAGRRLRAKAAVTFTLHVLSWEYYKKRCETEPLKLCYIITLKAAVWFTENQFKKAYYIYCVYLIIVFLLTSTSSFAKKKPVDFDDELKTRKRQIR